ncbi:MAG: DNA gyrase subunit A [Algisphaera sp.]
MAEDTPQTPDDSEDASLPKGPILNGNIQDLAIEQELADSYLTYAMSTIVDRALPDVRDGLKPSQRRVLVAMNDLNLRPGSKHRKCAKIAGDTSGNYHPHGEQTIYPTLVNMAQDWKMRHPLIAPQGNFGSIDPDPPAAMRYTEARMAGPAAEMLDDLKLDTVDWQENYDGTREEPRVLPGKFPNLLVNGGTGIAVGMATSLAPHNLGEICDAIVATLANPDIDVTDLMQIVPGPDFPTGGTIMGRGGIASAYRTGRGKVTVRAKIHHETQGKQDRLVVTEIPYQVSKVAGIIDKIVVMNKAGRLEDISDIVDESSNRGGMRMVIKLKRGASPEAVENQLYSLTPLQSTFSIINIALVKGQPRTLTLKQLIEYWIEHRVEVVRRKTAFLLNKAQQEAHKIEGLIYAVCDIDEIIRLIRSSTTRDEAIEKLMARGFRIPADHEFAPKIPKRLLDASVDDVRLTRVQAEAIGRLQLIQLVGLEIEKLVNDYAKIVGEIEDYESILADPKRVEAIILEQIAEIKNKYANPRKTIIEEGEANDLDLAALTPVQQVAVTITHSGYVKRLPVSEYKTQARGGKGVIGAKAKNDDDFTEEVFVASTHDDLLCFTDTGRVFKIRVFNIPEAGRTNRGRAMINLIRLKKDERIVEFMPIADFEKGEDFLFFATKNGLVKRTALADYRNVNAAGINAINLKEGDALVGVKWASEDDHVLLGTASGMAIRFRADDARAMGRAASGVKGINLAANDTVVGVVRIAPDSEADLLTVTENGYGKRTPTSEYLVHSEDGSTRTQGRGGKGRKDIQTTERNGQVISLRRITPEDGLMLITQNGMIVRINAETIRQTHRNSSGVRVISLKPGDKLTAVAPVQDAGNDDDDSGNDDSSDT